MSNVMRNSHCLIAIALLCIFGAGRLPAPVASSKSVDQMLAASDGIVVGTIAQGTVSGATVAMSIQVERVLKGTWPAGAVIAATGTLAEPSGTRAMAHDRGIFFLGNSAAGPLMLIPVTSGFVPLERWIYLPLPDASSPPATSVATSTRERVSLEILAGIEAGPLKQPGGYIDPESAYVAAPTAAVRSVFYRWLGSGSPRLAALSLSVLLGAGNRGALARLASDRALRSSALEPGAYDGLKFHFQNADPAAVRLLGQLAGDNSGRMDLRAAAASALAKVHTRQALPFPAQFLDSTDSTIRSCGVGGLAMFANNVPIGSYEPAAGKWPWRTGDTIAHSAMVDSQDSVRFWKNWWTANRALLTQ